MLIFVIAVVIVVVTIVAGMILAAGSAQLDGAVKQTQLAISNKDEGYNLSVTLGHRIPVEADLEVQLKEARLLAAKRAAALPRGANMGIGRLGNPLLKSAGRGLESDPQTAVKIAAFHGWDGAKSGVVVAAPVAAPVAAVGVSDGSVKLVPGKDYPVTEITDGMSPAEKRKARIANAKAKSAAMKAAKAAGATAAPAGSTAAAPVAEPTAAAVAAAPTAHLPSPPTLIELSDEMSPDEKRKARIANAKAKSAYNKAVKAAGGAPSAAGSPVSASVVPVASAEPTVAATAAAPTASPVTVDIAKPDYVELSEDMSPDDKRKARIHNAKARSAYNKALKAAGIDPKSVK